MSGRAKIDGTQVILNLTGAERGGYDANCIASYFALGLPEATDKWRRYDESDPGEFEAHRVFRSLLGVEVSAVADTGIEHLQASAFSLPEGGFFTRQSTQHPDRTAQIVIYHAWYS